jgi:hypothetical protein
MFGWLKRRIQLASLQAATEDIDRIIASLQGMTASEVGMLVALATFIRVNLKSEGIDLQVLLSGDSPPKSDAEHTAILQLHRLIRTFQSQGQMSDAAALMLWQHSLRIATLYPELRNKGRVLWHEAQRGFSSVEGALDDIGELTGREIPIEAYISYRFVPYAFRSINS